MVETLEGVKLAARAPRMEMMSTDEDSKAEYLYVDVKAPVLAGFPLKCFAWLLETGLAGSFLLPKLKKDNLITKTFLELRYEEPPMYIPQYAHDDYHIQEQMVRRLEPHTMPAVSVECGVNCLPPYVARNINKPVGGVKGFGHRTIRDYAHAYSSGRITPTQVAEQFISAIEDSRKAGMNLFIAMDSGDVLSQAAAATERYKQGKPLSVLDGVPIAVKDEIDCLPYRTTGGTTWLGKVREVKEDAEAVKRLRSCGAVMVGKTNMHELGMGTTGINPHYGATRNPHNILRVSGGSSGGSSAAVAAGICPAALGVDGGGSVRMPAGLCGVVGFKPTFGRTSNAGVLPLNWTVGMLGTLTGSVEDALIMYAAMHGPRPDDDIVSFPPPANLPLLKDPDEASTNTAKVMGDLKFAKFSKWFDDCDEPVRNACHRALQLVQTTFNTKVVEVTIPEIEEMRLAHFVTIGSECCTSLGVDYRESGLKASGADVRVTSSIYGSFNNREFIGAQRMRFRQMHYHNEIFKKANIIISPTTGATAPLIRRAAEKCGELDYVVGAKLMRYQIAGNFLGLPALSVPFEFQVGHDADGLPIGMQLIGRPWSEATLLQVAAVIERLCSPFQRRPEVLYDLLSTPNK
ncbi:fatty acid amide hydrolase isoform X2 [Physcomitrium patens]|uniref:fatty acid amide hydrolase isoform X2 n=1 Tax=Physcomitrium patens TaxID=3218 RepID=UPI000D158202|nr:fatty acid amide hydrolase-like isoform X2 [Physcomitrium patens]|eukprot:XP_024366996.1 fatty acid amide hydrolase-like isoform X2 [Physcomitrella patens]